MPCCIDRLRFSLGIFRFVIYLFSFFFRRAKLLGRGHTDTKKKNFTKKAGCWVTEHRGRKKNETTDVAWDLLFYFLVLKGSVIIVGPLLLFFSLISHQFALWLIVT